ncbi:helix-turn-helix domain-containing protein [Leptolyngbya sp. FACHB-541]|uniref:helix-turn-helix domain-containing protein n=1 Tax=Leptolyngbya sp. FACHB-541 TaxID=2692810 RepID=UPI001684A188|nr:helix-turn-helix domain-containing protein [Leptolyngbya sp. FACHB-541]
MSKLNPIQLEQLKEIGVQLHQTREQQSKSLEEVAAKTFIPLRLLQAIEVGQAAVLPEPVFIQGFIRRYGDLVGLDGMALSKQFSLDSTTATSAKIEQPKVASPQPIQPQPVQPQPVKSQPVVSEREFPVAKAVYTPTLSPNTTSSDVEPELTNSESSRTSTRFNPLYALYGIAGILIIGGGIFLIGQIKPQSSEFSQETAESNVSSSSTPTVPQTEASPVASPQPSAVPTDDIEVSINLTEASWLRVTVDGEIQYEGILPQGEQQTWSAKEQVVIRAGNAGAVLASLNGASPEPLGTRGAVATVTFLEAE